MEKLRLRASLVVVWVMEECEQTVVGIGRIGAGEAVSWWVVK